MPVILTREHRTTQGYTEDLGNGVGLDMVFIPGGTFTMGSPPDEIGRDDDEGPQHQVTVSTFCMGQYPVTQQQWRVVAGWEGGKRNLKSNPSHFKGDQHPVESVTWDDAVEFCDQLTQKTGRHYGLPSEAEWEYACRAGTTTPFHFGNTITPDLACYDWSYIYAETPIEKRQKPKGTMPVGQFPSNPWGLYDLHGNVWEWCEDHWHGSYEGNPPNDGSAWIDKNAETQARRALRGGSWFLSPRLCRSATRYGNVAGFGYGFRVVCRPPRTL